MASMFGHVAPAVLLFLGIGSTFHSCHAASPQPAVPSASAITSADRFPLRAYVGLPGFHLKLNVSIPASIPGRTADVEAILRDSSGTVVLKKTSSLVIAPSSRRTVNLELRPFDYGYYAAEVTVRAEGGRELGAYSTSFAALRPLSSEQLRLDPLQSRFGVNLHFGHGQGDPDVTPGLLSLAGIRWVRDSLYWQGVEKDRGQYSLPERETSIYRILRKKGIRILSILAYSNDRFYKHATSEESEAYGRYAEFMAREFSDVVDHFEIWNEPNSFSVLTAEQYVPILISGYEGVKRGNPKAFVIGMGGSSPGGWSSWYTPEVVRQGAARYMDSFSIHPYSTPSNAEVGYVTSGGAAPRSSLDYADILTHSFADQIRSAKGLSKPPGIWITEDGWPSNKVGSMGQAMAVARAYVTAAARPDLFERLFVYDFICDGKDPDSDEHNFGMLNYDLSIRPSYVATAAASRAIDGRPFLRRIEHPYDGARLYLFGPEDDAVLVGWVTECGPSEILSGRMEDGSPVGELGKVGARPQYRYPITLRGISCPKVSVRDWEDRQSTVRADDGVLRLQLSTMPIYVHLGSASDVR